MASITVNDKYTFTPEELSKTFVTYRKEILSMVFMAMQALLAHCGIRTGIRFKEVITSISGNFEMGNYSKTKLGDGLVNFRGRTLQTYFGNLIEPIDPNAFYQTIWGSNITKGEGLKNVPITLLIASYIVKKTWENVVLNSFTAAHDDSDTTTTAKWFNGFKTIIDNDIAGTNELSEVLISEDLGNLANGTEAITAENAEDIIKEFYWGADYKLRSQNINLYMSDMAYHYYTEAYQLNHGSLPYNQAYDKRTLEGASNVTFVALPFVPDNFLLLTPKNNMLCLFNQKSTDETYLIAESKQNHYDVDVIINAFFGTQFERVDKEYFRVWEYNESGE